MNYSEKKIIIFGASKAGEKAYEMLKGFDFKVVFFMDNDNNKFDNFFCGIKVKSPSILNQINMDEYLIVIASMFYDEISSQLGGYNLIKEKNYIEINKLIKYILKNNMLSITKRLENISFEKKLFKDSSPNILITLPRGLVLGGIENWSITINKGLKSFDKNSYLVNLEPSIASEVKNVYTNNKIIDLNFHEINYFNALISACNEITKYLPCTIINNDSFEILQIAYILKKMYPDSIKIISVLHGDVPIIYYQNIIYSEVISKFLCVSQEIERNLIKYLPERKNDIVSKISPVELSDIRKNYTCAKEPIKIGFAGRLVKEQKRCDYLLKLIEELELTKVNYEIHIAGTGPYYDVINKFIINENLKNKVKLYGLIPYDKMNDFWSKLDIYLNLSDYEGTSLSMLEAMGNGVVPIVTDVSGVELFIKNKINGFVINRGDIETAKKIILYLYKNKNLLEIYGAINKKIIRQQCSVNDYIKYLLEL